jgi:hypothetical protein
MSILIVSCVILIQMMRNGAVQLTRQNDHELKLTEHEGLEDAIHAEAKLCVQANQNFNIE